MSTTTAGTLEELKADVRKSAELLNLPIAEVVWDIIDEFQQEFLENPVGFRITTKDDALNVRYQTLKAGYTYGRALKHNFITRKEHPVHDVMTELYQKYPDNGFLIDLGVTHGLEKIWGYFPEPMSIEQVAALESAPAAIAKNLELLKKYDLNWVGVIGVDYVSDSINIYFMRGSFPNSPEIAQKFVEEAGFPTPPAEDAPFNGDCFVLYLTFTWDSDQIERISYARAGTADEIPGHWDAPIHDFAAAVPLRGDMRTFTFNTCYRREAEPYYKLEADYRNTIPTTVGPLIEGGIAARQAAQQPA